MDVELALIAEQLQTMLPYRRGDKNDRRTAHEFLDRLVADGKKCFQKKAGTAYEKHQEALQALEEARRLRVSWGNKASHRFDIVPPEAAKLIDVSEMASSPSGARPVASTSGSPMRKIPSGSSASAARFAGDTGRHELRHTALHQRGSASWDDRPSSSAACRKSWRRSVAP